MKRLSNTIRSAFQRLSSREQTIVSVALCALVVYCGWWFVSSVVDETQDIRLQVTRRQQSLLEVNSLLQRYAKLYPRLESVTASYAKSELSFEQVTTELDKVIRNSVGTDAYDLKKMRNPVNIGEFDKQEFTVNIRSITLEQLIKTLYQLQHGGTPLFLGKIKIDGAPNSDKVSATLEVYSIRSTA